MVLFRLSPLVSIHRDVSYLLGNNLRELDRLLRLTF